MRFSKKLKSLGLPVNQKKVKVRTTEDLINNRSFKIFDLSKEDRDRKDQKKVEQFVDYYLDLLDKLGLVNIKDNGTSLLNKVLDKINEKYGDFTICRAPVILAGKVFRDSIGFGRIKEL